MEVELAAFEADVPAILHGNGDVDIAVAFVTEPGLDLVRSAIHEKLLSGGRVRFLLDLRQGATDPSALWDLVALNEEFPDSLLVRAYAPDKGILHSKVYIAGNDE